MLTFRFFLVLKLNYHTEWKTQKNKKQPQRYYYTKCKDIVYIDLYETWYCIECQENDRIWYHPMGSEEDKRQHDYINYYYEQKEKFMKRFQNKDNSIIEK